AIREPERRWRNPASSASWDETWTMYILAPATPATYAACWTASASPHGGRRPFQIASPPLPSGSLAISRSRNGHDISIVSECGQPCPPLAAAASQRRKKK